MSLDNIVSVTISKQSASVSRVGFGTPMIMSCEANIDSRFVTTAKEYTTAADMVTDGFVTDGLTYLAASAMFSQNPKPSKVVIGKRATLPTQIIDLTVASTLDSTLYEVIINGTTFPFTSDATATNLEIAAGLVLAINAGAEDVLATDALDGTFTVEGASAGTPGTTLAGRTFSLSVSNRSHLTQQDVTLDAGVAADLTTIRQAVDGNDDWYALYLDTRGDAEITALAAAIETIPRIFGFTTANEDVITVGTSDIASTLQALNYTRTYGCWHPDPHAHMAAAWGGKQLPTDPGSTTWKFKTIVGIAATTFSSTEAGYVVSKGMNSYQEIAGRSTAQDGVMVGGEFIDITRGIDWTTQRLKENIFGRLMALPKIPFTDTGIALIENEVWGVLNEGIGNGLFAASPAPTVTVPLASDVDATDKANRNLPDVNFTAQLAGAIHSVVVSGIVTV